MEMWLWRRMDKISYTERVTNEEVLRRVGEERQLLNLIRNRKKNWIGHILRRDGIVKEVIEGRMEGKRSRGRPRAGMLDDLVVVSYGDTKRRAENRGEWLASMDLPRDSALKRREKVRANAKAYVRAMDESRVRIRIGL